MKRFQKVILFIITIIFVLIIYSTFKIYKSASYFTCRKVDKKYLDKIQFNLKQIEKYNPEKKEFLSYDNVPLSGLLFYRPNAKRVILIAHGYRGAKEFLASLVELFDKDTLFLFDFRAHGQSKYDKISFGDLESYDIKAALDLISQDVRFSGLPIYGLGFSMGAAALVKSAYEKLNFNGLILDSGYSNFKEQAENWLRQCIKLPLFLIKIGITFYEKFNKCCFKNLDINNLISKINVPVFIIHSESDQVTPVSNAYSLYKKALDPKEIWIVKEAKHAQIFKSYPQEYKEKIESFFRKIEE